MDLGAAHSEDHLAINRGAESTVSNAALVYCAVPSCPPDSLQRFADRGLLHGSGRGLARQSDGLW